MIITLDAGHYGNYNQSPALSGYYESKAMWSLHLHLKRALEAYGITVRTTRKDQAVDMEVYSRGKYAKGSDLFLSLHSNAVGNNVNETVDYPVCYVPLNGKGDAIGKKIATIVESTMKTKQSGRISTRAGNNGDYYGVIRGAVAVDVPGIIVEHSFHTQTNATKWLLQDDNLQKLANAEADIIAAHYGIKKPAVKPPVAMTVPAEKPSVDKTDNSAQEQVKQEEKRMTQVEFNTYMNEWQRVNNPLYNTLDDVPTYWSEEVRALINGGFIVGDGVHELAMRHETLRAVIVAGRVAKTDH